MAVLGFVGRMAHLETEMRLALGMPAFERFEYFTLNVCDECAEAP